MIAAVVPRENHHAALDKWNIVLPARGPGWATRYFVGSHDRVVDATVRAFRRQIETPSSLAKAADNQGDC